MTDEANVQIKLRYREAALLEAKRRHEVTEVVVATNYVAEAAERSNGFGPALTFLRESREQAFARLANATIARLEAEQAYYAAVAEQREETS